MLCKTVCAVLTLLGLVVFAGGTAVAKGPGVKGPVVGGTPAFARYHDFAHDHDHDGRFPPRETNFYGAYRNGYLGYGSGYGFGYGYGGNGYVGSGYGGWGYSPLLFGYPAENLPYFALFPPVYYGSTQPMPNPGSVELASPSSQPLRVINPYFYAPQAEYGSPQPEAVPPPPAAKSYKPKKAETPESVDLDWPF